MNTRALAGILLMGIAGSLGAQTPATPAAKTHRLSLYATVAGSGGSASTKGKAKIDPGGVPLGGNFVTASEQHLSSQRQSEDVINLAVEVRNLSPVPDTA